MDRYEYKLKLDQMKDLFEGRDYQTAATIADTINWKKVKNTSSLCMVGEIYARTKQYEHSKDILLMAYERSPLGRPIIYRLTQVAVKLGNLDEAEEYYEEFLNIAPYDNMKYVLKYEIEKARGSRQEELIEILEDFKALEYTEEWTFELAYLYHKAEMGEKCVEVCDELILWFGEGEFVEKALELKMFYQPLNQLQEDKYNRIKMKQDKAIKLGIENETNSAKEIEDSLPVHPVVSNTGKYSTLNLQAELAKSMLQIIDAKEKETVSDTMKHIKNMVKDTPYFEMPKKEEEKTDNKTGSEIQYNRSASMPGYDEETIIEEDINYLAEQITSDLSIGDILDEWEEVQEKEEQKQLDHIKSRALNETQELLEQITDALPELQAAPNFDNTMPLPQTQAAPNFDNTMPLPEVQAATNLDDTIPLPEMQAAANLDNTIPLPELKLPEFLKAEAKINTNTLSELSITFDEELEDKASLTQEQKELFSYFIAVEGMEKQILKALNGIVRRKQGQKTSLSGNLVIVGGRGFGKTKFAACMIKAVQKLNQNPTAKVGKITGASMNQKDIVKLLKKVEGGYLIIEKAGDLSKESVLKLSSIMDYDTKGLLVILEDTKVGIEKVLSRHAMFTKKFTEKIRIPVFTSNELVSFAQAYAKENEFDIDEMGILALYNCISNIQRLDEPTTLEEVKEIMNQAMEKSSKGKFLKIFGGKKYNDKGYVYLRERDFDEY